MVGVLQYQGELQWCNCQSTIDLEPLHLERHTTTPRYRHSHATDRRLRNSTTYLARNTIRYRTQKPEPGVPGSEWPPWPHKAATRLLACPCRRATRYRCRRRRKHRSGIYSTTAYGRCAHRRSRVCLFLASPPTTPLTPPLRFPTHYTPPTPPTSQPKRNPR
jgi:hypothetical protein